MLRVNLDNWFKEFPKMDRHLRSAFMKAFTSYPKDKKDPTLDELLVEAVRDPSNIFTMEMMSTALTQFGADTADILMLLSKMKEEVAKKEQPQVNAHIKPGAIGVTPPPGEQDVIDPLAGTQKVGLPPRPNASKVLRGPGVPLSKTIPLILPVDGGGSDADTEDVEISGAEPGGVKKLFSGFGKKKDEVGESDLKPLNALKPAGVVLKTPGIGFGGGINRNMPGMGSSMGRPGYGGGAEKKKRNPNVAKWAAGILVLFILLISVGAFFQLNKSNRYSSEGSSESSSSSGACTTDAGEEGITGYLVMPKPEVSGSRGYTSDTLSSESANTPQIDSSKSYYAIKSGSNYIVATDINAAVYMSASSFFDNPASECIGLSVSGVLSDKVQKTGTPSVELAYHLNVKSWSGWMVIIAMFATFCFSLISLSLTGNNLWDVFVFLIPTTAVVFLSKTISIIVANLTIDSAEKLSVRIFGAFALLFIVQFVWSVGAGSKSETRQFSEEFAAGSQFKVPDSFKPVFESLSRGWGLIGGFDWTMAIISLATLMVVGALDLTASPAYMMFRSQVASIVFQALLIIALCGFETARRGDKYDWWSFGCGFIGFLDFPLLMVLFGSNPISISGMAPTALAIIFSLVFFVIVFGANFYFQTKGERMELMRDRMADGMLFYSALKLSAILLYIFLFV